MKAGRLRADGMGFGRLRLVELQKEADLDCGLHDRRPDRIADRLLLDRIDGRNPDCSPVPSRNYFRFDTLIGSNCAAYCFGERFSPPTIAWYTMLFGADKRATATNVTRPTPRCPTRSASAAWIYALRRIHAVGNFRHVRNRRIAVCNVAGNQGYPFFRPVPTAGFHPADLEPGDGRRALRGRPVYHALRRAATLPAIRSLPGADWPVPNQPVNPKKDRPKTTAGPDTRHGPETERTTLPRPDQTIAPGKV